MFMNFQEKISQDIYNFKNQNPNGIVIIYGPTATGKTSLSVYLASKFANTQVISSDSRQIYKYMNIWTDKISAEIRSKIPHHLIDIINPDENYTAADWQRDAYSILSSIENKDILTLLVGGTWLYIDTIYRNYNLGTVEANMTRRLELENIELHNPWYCHNLLSSFDPNEAGKHHPSSIRFIIRAIEIYEQTWVPKSIYLSQRPVKYPIMMVSLVRDSEIANNLIDVRLEQMVKDGLIEEVKWLMDIYDCNLKSMQSIDYKQVIWYLKWEYDYDHMMELLRIANHQLAKKQRTRFRKYKMESENNPKDNVVYKEYIIEW